MWSSGSNSPSTMFPVLRYQPNSSFDTQKRSINASTMLSGITIKSGMLLQTLPQFQVLGGIVLVACRFLLRLQAFDFFRELGNTILDLLLL